jgi:metallophosphoesterase (TIGR00282 family)
MRLLFLGDVFGSAGRVAVEKVAPRLVHDEAIDIAVFNVENATGGSGISPDHTKLLLKHAQLLTSGNHIWAKKEIFPYMDAPGSRLIRPMNYPPGAPGQGWAVAENGPHRLGVINIEGRVFMKNLDDPFRAADEAIAKLREAGVTCIFVDFHCEATSEKWAMGHYLDGRVSAVIGTHTHVQTADARVLKGGTAFLTDAGMCGPFDSIIGMRTEGALQRMLTQRTAKIEPGENDVWVQGAIVDIDSTTGKATAIRRVQESFSGSSG